MLDKEKEKKDWENITSHDVKDLILSVRLYPDRLNFMIMHSESEKILHSGFVGLENSLSYSNAVTNAFFDNNFLKLEFKKTFVYLNPAKWCIIPSDLYHEEKAHLWIRSITEYNEDAQKSIVVSYKMSEDGKVFIYDLDKDLYDMLNRTIVNIVLKPHVVEVIEQIRRLKINANNKTNCISINRETIDFVELNNGIICKSCNFPFTNIEINESIIDEIIYFVASLYNNSPFDYENDFICIFYNKDVSSYIDMDMLRHRLSGYSKNIILRNTDI